MNPYYFTLAFLPTMSILLLLFNLVISKNLPNPVVFMQVKRLWLFSFCLTFYLFLNFLLCFFKIGGVFILFYGFFEVNLFSLIFQLIIIGLAVCIIVFSYEYDFQHKMHAYENDFLFSMVIFGACLLVVSNNFVLAYLALELQAIPLYVLISSFRLSKKAVESALKYFILNIFSSVLFLYGVALIYYVSGLLNLSDIFVFTNLANHIIFGNPTNYFQSFCFYTGVSCLLVSLLFKLSAAPFHFWAPEVYEGAPASIVFIFSVVTKTSAFVFMFNLFTVTFSDLSGYWSVLFIFFGVVSLIVGMIGAFYYSKVTKILAFGATAHVGYILIAVGSLTTDSLNVASFYLVTYLIATVLFFALWLNITLENNRICTYVDDFIGLNRVSVMVSVLLASSLFSFAGIPPFVGFVAKLMVIQNLFLNYSSVIALFVLISSALSAVYYLRFIKAIFFAPAVATFYVFGLPKTHVLVFSIILSFLLVILSVIFFVL